MRKHLSTILLLLISSLCANAQSNDEPFRFDTIYRTPPKRIQNSTAAAQAAQTVRESTASARQTPVTKQRKGTWEIGGTLGMSFGDYTNINIAPQVGYSWNKYFTLGGGISYNYYEDTHYDQKINYAGLHIYGRAYPIDYLTVYVQPELHRRWGSIRGYPSEDNVFACLLLGAGAVIPMPKGNVTITFYYDVLQNRYTPHGNKIGYSVGYNFRF